MLAVLKKWSWLIFCALLVVALLPALQVLSVRWFDPSTTGTALQRWWTGADAAKSPSWRTGWTPAQELPRTFFEFVWLAEDQRFFRHDGFDWIEMQAAWRQWQETGQARGASTITMQAARTLFLWQGRSGLRKLLEAYYTVWMELLLDKRRIFEIYANVVELGPGIYGVEAAAEHWYGMPARQLGRNQMVSLVVILPNPLEWNPREPSPKQRQRQQRLLRRAAKAHFPQEFNQWELVR